MGDIINQYLPYAIMVVIALCFLKGFGINPKGGKGKKGGGGGSAE